MSRRPCPHTNFRKGQRIVITFNDGEKAIDKFSERKSGAIITDKAGRINMSDVRCITIYRGQEL